MTAMSRRLLRRGRPDGGHAALHKPVLPLDEPSARQRRTGRPGSSIAERASSHGRVTPDGTYVRPGEDRARQWIAPSVAPWMSTLQGAKIREATQRHYAASLVLFCTWLGRRTLPRWDSQARGEALAEFLEVMHQEKMGFEEAHRLLPAILWALLTLGATSKVAFPRLAPFGPRSNPLVPFGAIMLNCHDLLAHGRFESAFMVALTFETYLRPSELVALTGRQITLPAASGRGAARCAAITIGGEELQVEGKTGQFDSWVLLDLERQQSMVPILHSLKKRVHMTDVLWTLSQMRPTAHVQRAALLTEVEVLGMCLYSPQHAGASRDDSEGARSLTQIQARGQWRTFTSVIRYSKAGRLATERHKMTKSSRRAAAELGPCMGELFKRYGNGSYLCENAADPSDASGSSLARKRPASGLR